MESLPDIYVCLAVDHDKQTIIVLGFELADKDRANAKAQERAQEHFGHENAPTAVINMMQPAERIRGQLLSSLPTTTFSAPTRLIRCVNLASRWRR